MSTVEIVIGLVMGLIINEVTNVSPWLARRVVKWSAQVEYAGTGFAEIREEELQALINERPGNLFKLGTSLRFAAAAAAKYARRRIWGEEAAEVGDAGRGLLEAEPSILVARYLFPTERYRGEWKRHWVHPAKAWLVATVYAGLGIAAVVLRIQARYHFWFIAGIVTLYIGWSLLRALNWYMTRFVVSNKRLMSVEGVIRRRVGMIPLIRVTDMRYEQSAMARLLNYGTFRLESASRRNAMRVIKDLPNPNELYLRIVEEMYEPEAVEARLAGAQDVIDDGT